MRVPIDFISDPFSTCYRGKTFSPVSYPRECYLRIKNKLMNTFSTFFMASLKLKEYCTDNSAETPDLLDVYESSFRVYTQMTGSFMHEAILSSFGFVFVKSGGRQLKWDLAKNL